MTDSYKSPLDLNHLEIIRTSISFAPALSVSSPGAGAWLGGDATTTIAHNLGYTPVVLCYAQNLTTGKAQLAPHNVNASPSNTQIVFFTLWCYVDETNIYLVSSARCYGVGAAVTPNSYRMQYYLMREKAKRAT